MDFSEYYASFITPQMTLLEKYNAICKFLLDNEFKKARYLHVFRIQIKGQNTGSNGSVWFNDFIINDTKEKLLDDDADLVHKTELVNKLNEFSSYQSNNIILAASNPLTERLVFKKGWRIESIPVSGEKKVGCLISIKEYGGTNYTSFTAYDGFETTIVSTNEKLYAFITESVIEL